jgi:hypothetical protein
MMTMDEKNDYICPICNYFYGSQNKIYNHLLTECPKFFVECECNNIFIRDDFHFHLFLCPKYEYCSHCNQYSKKTDYKNHMKNIHNLIYCNLCAQYIHINNIDRHCDLECPDRLVFCEYCLQLCKYKLFKEHLTEHHELLIEDLKILNEKYHECLDKYNLLKKLFRPFENLLE